MTFEGSISGFRSLEQADAIASILEYMSRSIAYDEEKQATAKTLAGRIKRYIKEGIVLTNIPTYSRNQENILAEAIEIYTEAKRQND